jgi:uncharacterized RDD family membrane protein YckC
MNKQDVIHCPFCEIELAATLSICPHCAKDMNDPIFQELFSKVKPIQRPVLNLDVRREALLAARAQEAPVRGVAPSATDTTVAAVVSAPDNLVVSAPPPRYKTAEIFPKNTSSTLVDFPGRHANFPAWRKELQSKIKEYQTGSLRSSALNNQMFAGNTALAMALVDAPDAEQHPLLEKVLRKIETSRQKYEKAGRNSSSRDNMPPAIAPIPTGPDSPAGFPPVTNLKAPATITAMPVRVRESVYDPGASKGNNYNLSIVQLPHRTKVVDLRANPDEPEKNYTTGKLHEMRPISAISGSLSKKVVTYANAARAEAVAASALKTLKAKPGFAQFENVEPAAEASDELASLAFRFNAALFDSIIGGFLSLLLLTPFILLGGQWFTMEGFFAFLATAAIVMFIYLTVAVGLVGKTFGMSIFGIEVVDVDDNEYPTFHQAAVNSSVYLLSLAFAGLGFLTMLMNDERRCLHDLLSGTVVVREL